MKTSFEKVSALNIAFGNPKGDLANPNVKAIRKQALLCLEEASELVEAAYPGCRILWQFDKIKTQPEDSVDIDLQSLLDAQGDLTTVNEGLAHIAGFDSDEVYNRVHASNMSKFITNIDEREAALNYYYDLGFKPGDIYLSGTLPQECIKVTSDITVAGKFYPAGKFLKNMLTFKEPDFSGLLS